MLASSQQAPAARVAPAAIYNTEIEVMTAELARLARAAVIVAERVFDEMNSDPAAAALVNFIEADVDVLQDQLRQIDEIARPLRVACRPA